MKKSLRLLLFSCLLKTISFSQPGTSTTCVGQLYYSFSHKTDSSIQSDSRFKETAVLSYGKNLSVYQSHDRIITEQKDAAQKAEMSTNGNLGVRLYAFGSKDKYYYIKEKKEIQRIRPFGVPTQLYSMSDKNISINWKIEPEIKQIGNFNCQKATASFRGRNWTAWFCNDIPFGYGPWMLTGLPGLILEAYDQHREVEFLFKEINNVAGNITIAIPQETISTDEVNFEKVRQAYYESIAFSSGGSITASGSMNNNNAVSKNKASNKYNNPIDLTSKALRRPYWY